MFLRDPSYHAGFAPRDFMPKYPAIWNGCVGAWAPCLGPTGLTVRDWSGKSNHAALENLTAASAWVVDQGKYAIDFPGSSNGVLRTVGGYNNIRSNNTHAVSLWFVCDSLANSPLLICSDSTANEFFLELGSAGQIYWGYSIATFRTYSASVSTGTLYHLFVVKTGVSDSGDLYLNGRLLTSYTGTLTGIPNTVRDTLIGNYAVPTVDLNGRIDDVAFYNWAATPLLPVLYSNGRGRGIAYTKRSRRKVGSPLPPTLRFSPFGSAIVGAA